MTQWKPKQLEWEGLKSKNGSGIEYYLEQYKNGDYHAFCCAAITEPLDRYENEQEAKAACQADFERRWQSMSEPQPFWKPTSEFEKTNGNQCLILDGGKLLQVEYDANLGVLMAEMSMLDNEGHKLIAYKSFHLSDLTHFADVPNLEASNAKV